MRPLAALLALLPGLAMAEPGSPPIDAQAFEDHVTGKTLTYEQSGAIFGIEEYLPDRKVRWSVAPNACQYGSWYPEGENICFVYEGEPLPSCWTFWLRDGALVALSVHAVPGEELTETAASAEPLPCPGPDVGV